MPDGPVSKSVSEVLAHIRAAKRQEAEVVRVFVAAVATGDLAGFAATREELGRKGLWRRALAAASRLPAVPPEMQDAFLRIWKEDGDNLRSEVNDDLVWTTALRILLPPYQGGPLTLYRGDSAWNRQRRTYGLSWTMRREVAEGFANGMWRSFEGGSVLLQVEAPPESIICALALLDNSYDEDEYLVDRRHIRRVRVLRRFDQRFPLEMPSDSAQ